MWTYVFRRLLLMIPTLWGVTIVSFLIMQLAPGDPLLLKAGRTGVSGQTSQTREAYLIQKRDLCLDKPLVLNFNYFRDYTAAVRVARKSGRENAFGRRESKFLMAADMRGCCRESGFPAQAHSEYSEYLYCVRGRSSYCTPARF